MKTLGVIFISIFSLALFVGVNIYVSLNSNGLPKIQGVVIPEARDISEFTLVDHHNQVFTKQHLKDSWHIVSYGFTDCPDICPTTLNKLAKVSNKLKDDGVDDVKVLFYTVDPQRDTVDHLSQYISFFNEEFLGLTWGAELASDHIPFEKSLGITSAIDLLSEEEASKDYKGYRVSHGVVLYVLNPEGKLQAILKPQTDKHGLQYFTTDQIYQDYLAIRSYFG